MYRKYAGNTTEEALLGVGMVFDKIFLWFLWFYIPFAVPALCLQRDTDPRGATIRSAK